MSCRERLARCNVASIMNGFLDPPEANHCLGRLGPYSILEVIGEGGMGIVFKAQEPQPRRTVAIKVMRPEVATPEFRTRFLRESQLLATVEHERVVPVFRVDEFRGLPFLVMPFLQGESLACRLQIWRKRRQRDQAVSAGNAAPRSCGLPLREVLRLGREIAEGLAASHAAGVIHRDIKPSNIWLRGDERHVVLLDFGLARPLSGHDEHGANLSAVGVVVGTAGYMAPEQARGGSVDARADLFSLGCVLHEMATGKSPFTGPNTLAVLSAVTNHQPPRLDELDADVPAELSSLVERLLAKSPEARPRSAAEVVAVLRAIERSRGDGSTIELPITARAKWRRKLRRWLAAAAVAAGLTIVVWAAPTGSDRAGVDASRVQNVLTSDGSPSPAGTVSTTGLRVLSIDVRHYARLNESEAVARGILGKQSFAPRLGDQATIEASLSRPAYAYLVAFRPDGVMELCFPDNDSQPPPLSERLRYPPPDRPATRYGLSDGVGLWVFAVVASPQPLPAFREFSSRHKPAWPPQPKVTAGVWWYDGQWIEPLTASSTGTSRGKGEQALGTPAEIVRAAALLNSAPIETIAAIGFSVGP